MAWQQYLPDDRLKWTPGWDSHPIWPSEPDVSAIKNLVWSNYARPSLAHSESLDSLQEKERLEVEFLADGAHHKVYNVNHPEWSAPLVFRVAIPLDPAFKMKSEMATLGFLRERTTIPVPRCVAWGLAADTELGYDWCLMEKLPGVELRHVWRKIPMEKKLELTDRLAGILSQLWKPERKFNQIGSIYVPEEATDSTSTTADRPMAGDATTTRYAIGPAVDSCYFSGWRCYLQPDRGPFPSCRDWLDNIITVERSVITTIKTLLDHKEDMTPAHLAMDWVSLVENELEIDSEDEFLQDYAEAIDTVQAYYKMLPELFPDNPSVTGQPRFSLYHADFREANVFVDPDTFEVTGILDWESAMTLPDWYGRGYPLLLQAAEPFDERIPKVPETFDEDDERYNPAMVSSFDRWELRILRNRYDEALEKLGWKDWRLTSDVALAKTFFLEGASLLGTDLDQAKRKLAWARETLDGDEEEGEEGEEGGNKEEGGDTNEEEDKKEERNKNEEEGKREEGDRSEGTNEKEVDTTEEEDKREKETLVIRVA